jgi:Uma2 family endonuclease
MATATAAVPRRPDTFADLLHLLGDVPLERIRAWPAPGTATEKDVVAARESAERRLCELVNGVLVEKAMGSKESFLAVMLAHLLFSFLDEKDLGVVLGADGALRLRLGLVRIPDVSFTPWSRMPKGELPDEPIATLVPTLAVEVLSESNTKNEMAQKLRDYFEAGVRLVWYIEPETETATVYTSPTKARPLGKDGVLEGGKVLPGFSLPLKDLFARAIRKQRKAR